MSLLTEPRSTEWIGCIDFGTALSKVALVRRTPRAQLCRNDVHPLVIGGQADSLTDKRILLPSIVYVTDDGRILFGHEAQTHALHGRISDRQALASMKQYLSTRELRELDEPLDSSIDPTEKYTAGDLLTLFLAHLLAQAGTAAATRKLPWPVPLRLARPAWEPRRAEAGEQILQRLLLQAFAIVDDLGTRLCDKGGIADEHAFNALRNAQNDDRLQEPRLFAQLFELDGRGSASVLEATAVAAGSIRDAGRRVVVVADIGGGTCDFGAFLTGFPGTDLLAEISPSSHVLKVAGDHLDMLLAKLILGKAGIDRKTAAGKRMAGRLRASGRAYKETLFSVGTLTVRLREDVVTVTEEEFLAEPDVMTFAWKLRQKFDDAMVPAVTLAKLYSTAGGLPVEILLSGGGHALPMVRRLVELSSLEWTYTVATPDIPKEGINPDFGIARPQLAVAIGGAVQDLPRTFVQGAR